MSHISWERVKRSVTAMMIVTLIWGVLVFFSIKLLSFGQNIAPEIWVGVLLLGLLASQRPLFDRLAELRQQRKSE